MILKPFKAALFLSCAAIVTPVHAQDDGAIAEQAGDRIVVYAQDTGEVRGFIDADVFIMLLESPDVPQNVKDNLNSGAQWAVMTVDGQPGWVGAGFECVKDPSFDGLPQCGDIADKGIAGETADVFALSIPRTQPPLTRIASVSEQPEGALRGRVVFTSSDGSAGAFSRSVFTLRDVSSGEAVLVPVEGNNAQTRAEVFVQPGTYDVIPPAPSVNGYQSFYTSKVSTERIIVNRGGSPATVDFSLGVSSTPIMLRTNAVTSSNVGLQWQAVAGVGVQSFTLVRTDGDVPAASETAGTVVARGSAGTTDAVAQGLSANSEYTFTLFPVATDGKKLPSRSITVVTARRTGGTESAYALAPNTMVANDYASLNVEPVSTTSIRIALSSNVERGSVSSVPGIAPAKLDGNSCVVGTPFLVTTDVAGDNSFYGLIDACEGPPARPTSAIVNRHVPLTAVFDYFMVRTDEEGQCYDAMTGQILPIGAEACTELATFELAEDDAEGDGDFAGGADSSSNANGGALPFAGQTDLVREQRYYSQSGNHYLVFQNDGNLVVYRADGGYVWGLDRQPGVQFGRIGRVSWQADGNLAAYTSDDQYIWSALTRNPDPNAQLVINPQGTFQIIGRSGVMWSASIPDQLSQRAVPTGASPSPAAMGMRKHAARHEGLGYVAAPVPAKLSHGDELPGIWSGSALSYIDSSVAQPQPAFGAVSGATKLSGYDPARYSVGRAVPAYRMNEARRSVIDSGYFAPAGSVLPATMMAARRVSCESSGSVIAELRPRFTPIKKFDLEVERWKVAWDIDVGVRANFSPRFIMTGSYECALDLPSVTVPIAGPAVPVSFKFTPQVSAAATATLSITGPGLQLDAGITSKGYLSAGCSLWSGCRMDTDHKTGAYASFIRAPAKANLTGELTFKAGLDTNLGFGYSIGIAGARAGLSLELSPLSAEVKAQAGTDTCATAAIGFEIDAKLKAEAYIPLYSGEKEISLYESGLKPYPGASFEVGDCGDD